MKQNPASKQTEQDSNGWINMRLRSGNKPRPNCFCRLYANLLSSADRSYWITKNINKKIRLHVLPQHPKHMYCGTVKTKFFQSFLCLSYPMYTSCGHYIHKSTARTNKQINKTTIILILIKTQKKYPKGIKHFLTYIFDYTHPILKDLSDKNMSGPTYCFIQWV